MAKKNKRKAKTEFDAYKYAHDFEKLSLEIVKIYSNNFSKHELISSDVTKKTRDKGVDAYVVIKVQGLYSTYTVEAKLRTSDTLSLKDFATSILYYLLNSSSKHFVVTNILYSPETIKYIEQLNRNKYKSVELIDGVLLRELINQHLSELYSFPPKLIEYIHKKELKGKPYTPEKITTSSNDNTIINLTTFNNTVTKIVNAISEGYSHILVTGYTGVGKSTCINAAVKLLENKYTIFIIDIDKIQTPKLLILEILRIILGIDIDCLFSESSLKNEINIILGEIGDNELQEQKIIDAIEILLHDTSFQQEEYVYAMHLLINHLYELFFINTPTIFVFEKLHMASTKMIKFTLDVTKCLSHKNIIILWEILLIQNNQQLLSITSEQWYGYIQLLEHMPSKKISIGNLTEADIYEIIKKGLPEIVFSNEFYNTFLECFNTNALNVFKAIREIKANKYYSAASIKNLTVDSSEFVINKIRQLIDTTNLHHRLYKEAITYAYILDGKLPDKVLEYLDNLVNENAKILLMENAFFFLRKGILTFPIQYLNEQKSLISTKIICNCAKWILLNINELNFNYLEKKYYHTLCCFIVSPNEGLKHFDDAIKLFTAECAYKYSLILTKNRYEHFQKQGNDLQYYKYLVIYLSYVQKNKLSRNYQNLVELAERLKIQNAILYSNDSDYIKTNLEFALTQYRIAKDNYDYNACQKYIEYILSYENIEKDREIFAQAYIYQALIYKELGNRKKFLLELSNAKKRYPNNKTVLISYYVNYAAVYKFKNMEKAMKLLQEAILHTYNPQKGHGDLETEINLLHLCCYQKQITLDKIEKIRLLCEKANSINNLAKTFNLEAYYHFQCQNIQSAIECLESAMLHSQSGGLGKQYFLFGLNTITLMLTKNTEISRTFFSILQWFRHHEKEVLKRLVTNPYRNTDHMYIAILSLLCIIKTLNYNNIEEINHIYKFLPELKDKNTKELLKLTPDYYILNKKIFILF